VRKFIATTGVYFLLILAAIFFIFPFLVAINTAFKPPGETLNVTQLPSQIYWTNFTIGFGRIQRGLLNSVLLALPAMLISTFVGTLSGYALSQFRFRGQNVIFCVLLGGMFLPYQAVLIPLFKVIRALELYDTIPGLILVHTVYGVPFTTFLLRSFFAAVPNELKDAALIDGCGFFQYYWRILLPVARTGIAATLILQFRSIWNEFLFGLSLTRSPQSTPVTVALQTFVGTTDVQWGPLMAGTLISILPTIIIFLLFKRHFVAGLTGVYK